ncbi:helix-hairpin-helix domain-containing protein [Streptomyces lavendulocolor]|uniref:helix-hairpin-helix domain-containing protein n=1 Tax=Streptomyces lavendulocolor TaxID=67316 RepID=UPI003C2D181B
MAARRRADALFEAVGRAVAERPPPPADAAAPVRPAGTAGAPVRAGAVGRKRTAGRAGAPVRPVTDGAVPLPPLERGGGRSRAGLAGRARGGNGDGRPVMETAGVPAGGSTAGAGPVAAGPADRWTRCRQALRERAPLWVQARCGMETRTVVALAVVLVLAVVLAGRHFWAGRPEPVRAPELVTEAAPTAAGPASRRARAGAPPVVVDVSGKVREPGVLRLPAGSRVADALRAAGGARPGTDLTGLNRARVVMDGEHIVVGAPAPPAGQAPPGASAPAGPGGGTGPVSLNSATVEQLDTLPGVGPVLARHIVDYRTSHGGFRSVDELREVNGIGERRFADLRPLVQP